MTTNGDNLQKDHNASLSSVLECADLNFEGSVQRLFQLLRIKSISTDPAYASECRKAAQWIVSELTSLGFTASARDTTGHPIVVAHRSEPSGAPHLLLYGHYDVQPVDPIEEWTSPPFEPSRRLSLDGIERVYARGAEDNKGQFMTLLEAIRCFIETTGGLPVSVTFFVEGEEETGSPSLDPFLRENRRELQADIALVCDTDMFDKLTPAITTRLRGLVFEEVVITGPSVDLHSGAFGGPAVNPIKILATIIGELHDDHGKVAVPGFYDSVLAVPDAIRQQWAELNFDATRFLANAGLKRSMGEEGYSVLEQIWARPTLELNGIVGGYTGAGTKTIIPSQASAKISCRLVANQNPEQIRSLIRAFISARAPAGVSVKFNGGDGSRAVHIAESNPYLKAATLALEAEWDRPAVFTGAGFSIPVISSFQSILGIESLMIGFGLDDDATHSPNEKFDLPNLHKGTRSWIRVIDALASVGKVYQEQVR